MSRIHIAIVALVALLVVGGSAWFFYALYVQPRVALRAEQKQLAKVAESEAAAVSPDEAAYTALVQQLQDASPATLQARWAEFLGAYPDSPRAAEARAVLGPSNMAALFDPASRENREVHTVAKGDSLYKIARKQGVTIDLIARANNLEGTMLQIGQQLVVPKVEITAAIDRSAKTLRLDNGGRFLREYPLLSVNVPPAGAGHEIQAKVSDAVVEGDGKRVTYGQKGYKEGRRVLILSSPGFTISSAADDTPENQLPPGIVVKDRDMADIFVLLTRGVPVTIR
ncbi:MAG: LysM peptidoglycan-binding domain-containing protein [Chthoniobacterales bacterium]|nr:LysM peptidoglycan-binding domain-containing protein [Chthoniobacterales bacterium]